MVEDTGHTEVVATEAWEFQHLSGILGQLLLAEAALALCQLLV